MGWLLVTPSTHTNPSHLCVHIDTPNSTTPCSHTHISHTHTPSPQGLTHPNRTLGVYPGKFGKGNGPRTEGTVYTPYRRPDRSTFFPSGIRDRPALLPSPTMGKLRSDNHPSPSTNRQLDDTYATLNELVSQLKGSTERMLCQYRMPLDNRPELSDGSCSPVYICSL